jgi:uncharacterized coiled-coil protein SlyX
MVGLNDVSVTTYSTSVDSRLSNLQTKSASVDISVTNINSFTASQNTKNSTLSTYTSSVDNRFTNLEITSASVDTLNTLQTTRIDQLAAATASVNSYTSSNDTTNTTQNNRLTRIEESTASLNSFTASNANTSLNAFTQSVPTTYEGIANASKVLVSGSSQLTASYDTRYSLSGSVLTSFSQSIDARLDDVEYTASISVGAGLSNVLTGINQHTASILLYTGSANDRFTNIEAATSSYETTGRGIVSGSSQITPLLPTGVISSSAQIDTLFNIDGIVSGSSQVTSLLPTGVVSGSSQITSLLPTGVVSGSSQLLDSSTIHSGSTNNYQFNSIGVGSATVASGVNGEIRAQGDITAFYSSDERLKENIQPIVDALSKVESISGNTYDWKEGFETIHSHTGHDIGVIAQEIEKVLPEVVTNRETGYKAVQYEKIVPLLIEAIKELSAKVKELESK